MDTARKIRDFFTSLRLTVALLALSIVLVFWATLAQADLGVWGVQQRFFHSLLVRVKMPGADFSVPVFPGGYLIGGLLFANLLGAQIWRFRFTWRKAGIWLTHGGIVLLLLGELLSGLLQRDDSLVLDTGQTRNYSESERYSELAITDATDPRFDEVVAIPEERIAEGGPIQHPGLPFRVVPRLYYPNARIQSRGEAPNAPPSPADQGVGAAAAAAPLPPATREDERNLPAACVELIGPGGSLGTWLVSADSDRVPAQLFSYGGRTWKIAMRFERRYLPFSLTLLKFSHDVYPGTDIPRNFSSLVRIGGEKGAADRDVLIYMNNPLRHDGLTFYQSGFANQDRTTILQVVRNPGWILPYIACSLMAIGLVLQFGLALAGFSGLRRPPSPAPRLGAEIAVPLAALALGLACVVYAFFPKGGPGAFAAADFGRLPVLADGRIKPMDTLARSSLLQLQGRQRVVLPDGSEVDPDNWLLDVLFRPDRADSYRTFLIDDPEVLSLIGKTDSDLAIKYPDTARQVMALIGFLPSRYRRFSYREISPYFGAIDSQARLAETAGDRARTPFQRAVLQLEDNLILYQGLEHALEAPGSADFLGELLRFQDAISTGSEAVRAKEAGKPHDEAAAQAMIESGKRYLALSQATQVRAIPPGMDAADPGAWVTAGQAILGAFDRGTVAPGAFAYAGLGHALRAGDPKSFNELVSLYRANLSIRFSAQLRKCDAEARFNAVDPFSLSMCVYLAAFFVALFSWLKWPQPLGRAAFWLVALAWIVATAGIATRMWLEGRPPVTNLYSSALFVGWGSVALCLVLEVVYRNAIGSVAAGLIGFGTLLIAHELALGGDTLEMMRAVLDSNFWLATHVVVVTTGYASTFLAGFLGLIYIVRGVFTRSLDRATADALARMVYGIVCFATLFSFVGTVLGGIWADQSWGRFWGWDPKENGALIIVLWNALILHARWGGIVRQRGLMCLAVFGNIVTGWSWFGTNMLGVGLHSYGFTQAAFWSLSAFVAVQLGFIALGSLPQSRWRSSGVA
jgi:ABC-type transport system involved in cytochrome c biogenesis permease subunit